MQDFGGTAKFIVMPGWKNFSDITARTTEEMGDSADRDPIPLMRAALNTAWSPWIREGLPGVPSDYYIGGVQMGWELPGSLRCGDAGSGI